MSEKLFTLMEIKDVLRNDPPMHLLQIYEAGPERDRMRSFMAAVGAEFFIRFLNESIREGTVR